jgi:O-antigen/teichoic acid export membrane protein
MTREGFVRSVGTLAGGTAFAQALGVLLLPVLTRIYSPNDFSVLAVYVSSLSILSVAACLRLEIAIPLPERDEDAANLLGLAMLSAASVAILVGVVLALLRDEISQILRQPSISEFAWLLPIGVWLSASYLGMQYWASRKKTFSRIARTRIVQSVSGTSAQIGLGSIGWAPYGLLVGHTISSCAGVFDLARKAWRSDRIALSAIRPSGMRRMAHEYSRFPKYSTWEALANNSGIQLPVLIIAAFAVGPEAGYLMLATRVMGAPMALVGGAVAQVYLAGAAEQQRKGTLADHTIQVLSGLAKAGVGPLVFAGIVAPKLFAIAFGSEWERAGLLLSWMTPWFVLQFLASPVSLVMQVTGRQRAMLMLTVCGLVLRLGIVWMACQFSRSQLGEWYAISGAVFYSACLVVFYGAAGVSVGAVVRALKSSVLIILGWVAFASIIRVSISVLLS